MFLPNRSSGSISFQADFGIGDVQGSVKLQSSFGFKSGLLRFKLALDLTY